MVSVADGGVTPIETRILFTVTLKVPAVVLPALSVAVTCSLVVPCGNVAPLCKPCVTSTVSMPLNKSSADGLKVTTAPAPEVAFAAMFGSAESEGGVLSRLIVNV